jgi:hypothetical protein
MNDILLDIPDITVIVEKGDEYKVIVNKANNTVTRTTGSYFTYADVAGLVNTASYARYAETSSYSTNFIVDGHSVVTGSLAVTGEITGSSVLSNEYKLNAGTVNITFTGSINTGLFGVTEYVQPYISTTKYSGMTVEYLAQRPGACRMGIIMASWLNTGSVVFTDISTTDIGDTSDITFRFLSGSDELRLRVNSAGSGSGPWTVQSLFKLFPNLNS